MEARDQEYAGFLIEVADTRRLCSIIQISTLCYSYIYWFIIYKFAK